MKAGKDRYVPAWRRKLLTLAVASCFAGEFAYANPTGPQVVHGQASIATQGNVLTVTNTPGTVINWQGFSIASQEITRFLQQSAASTVLNRVVGVNPSTILGQLQSNGRVFLINPNGITIGQGATVDVAGFLASTLNLSDADFLAGRYRFDAGAGGGAKVVNQGAINTPAGGMVYLVGQNVENHGVIRSPKGEILLAAGKSIELVDAGTPEIRVQITAPENETLNLGQLLASGGRIGMYGGLVRQGGVANANTAVVGENGRIVFKAVKDVKLEAGSTTMASGPTGGSIRIEAETGKATIAGTVEANAAAGRGGRVEVAGQQGVAVESTGRISANGAEGGAVTLNSSAGTVQIAGQVSATGSAGRGGEVAIAAATQASLAPTAKIAASGALNGGSVSVAASERVMLEAGSAVQVNGSSGGAVVLDAAQGSAEIGGTVETVGTDGAGGIIRVTALTDVILNDVGALLASGQRGGEVRIEARQGTTVAAGAVNAYGHDGPGGFVQLLGPRVGLIREANINVSGRKGGGTALVGGDFQGKNPEVPNAGRTYVGPDALITADAIETGNGGKVIIWADDITRFYGTISARGGALGGNGGFVEVSGKRYLEFDGVVDTRAPRGSMGLLLLDPDSIEIVGGATARADDAELDTDGKILFGEGSAASKISEKKIEDTAITTDIVLEAKNRISVSGKFDNEVNSEGEGVLLLQGGALTLRTRNAGTDSTCTGIADCGIDLTSSGTHGDNLLVKVQGAKSILLETGTGGAPQAADIRVGKLQSGTGSISIKATGTVTLANNLQTDGGLVDFQGSGTISLAQNVTIDTDLTGAADAGAVTFDTTANINGAKALVIDTTASGTDKAGGNVQLGAVGQTTALASLKVDSVGNGAGVDGTISLQATKAAGAIDVTADTGLVTLNGDLQTDGGAVDFTGSTAIKLAVSIAIDTTNNGGTPGGAGITLGGAVDGTAANTQSLTLNAGTGGLISATSTIGASTSLKTLTVTNSGGAGFDDTVTTGTVAIVDTADGAAVNFAGNLTASTGMSAAGNGAYNVALRGTANSIAGDTGFLNTGTVTLGDGAGDTTTFSGGLDTTAAAGGTRIAGLVQTTNAQMDLGATKMMANATLRSGSGAINVGSITDGASSFTLSLGSGTQTGAVTVLGDATVSKLATFAGAYDVALKGAITTIDADTTFLNTGTVRLGDGAGDTTTFSGGLDTTAAAGGTRIAGLVQTTNAQMDLGATTVTANATLNPGSATLNLGSATLVDGATLALGAGAVSVINAGAIDNTTTANSSSLVINTTGAVTISDVVGGTQALKTVQVTQSGGVTFQNAVTTGTVAIVDTADGAAVNFAGNLTASTGMSAAGNGAYNVALRGTANSIAGDTGFLNTGTVTLGDGAGDTTTFSGGLDTTAAAGGTRIAGLVQTTNAQMDLGATTMMTSVMLRSGSGAINVGSITDGASSFTLSLGSGTQTGAVTVLGDATVNKLATFPGAYDVALKGAITTIDGAISLINTGTAQLGDQTGDVISIAGGLNRTAGTTDLGGNITVTGPVSVNATTLVSGQTATLDAGANPVTFNATLDGAGGLIVNTSGVTTFAGVVGGITPLASLQTGGGGVTAINGGALITTGTQTYGDAVTISGTTAFATANSNINFDQTVTGPGGANDLTIYAGTAGNVTALGVVSGIQNLTVVADNVNMAGGIVHTINNLVTFNSTGDVNYAQNGNLNIGLSNITGAANITANNGSIITGGAGNGFTAGSVVMTATDGGGTDTGTLTVGAGGITTTGGAIVLRTGDWLTVNGPVLSNNGSITMVAGNAPGMASLGIAPAINAGGPALGFVHVNAPVRAGTGDITIYSTGPVTQSLPPVDAGLQTSKALTIRTYNNMAGGAPITLENDKLTGGVTCATGLAGTGNCAGQVAMETRRAGDTGTGSLTTFPGGFARSAIRFKSISGLQINGIGTGGEVLLEADSLSLFPGAINGTIVNIIATGANGGGIIEVGIPIPTSYINNNLPGGSLNLRAARDIRVLPTGSIGTKSVPFDHDLVLAAGNDINIQGSIFVNGNLNIRANAVAADLAGNAPYTGTGAVIIRSPGGSPVEVRAKNIVVGDAARPVITLTLEGGSAGTGQSADAILRAEDKLNINLAGNLVATGGTATASAPSTTATTADAILRGATVSLEVGGDLALNGGTSSVTSGAGKLQAAHADALLEGNVLTLNANGSVSLAGGNASAATGGNTASSSALITSNASLAPVIQGDLRLTGGTATAQPVAGQVAKAEALAIIHTDGDLSLQVTRDVIVEGGIATATTASSASSATADSGAVLMADGIKNFQIGRHFNVTGGNANTVGANATATALGGTDPGLGPSSAETLRITTGGNMTLRGGAEFGANTLASAAILAAGEIKLFVNGSQGLVMDGGGGTDLFQLVGTTLISLEGKGYPVTITGGFNRDNGLVSGDAFIISGAPPLNLDSLLAAFLRTTDCVTFSGGSCTVPGANVRADTTRTQGGAGTCK